MSPSFADTQEACESVSCAIEFASHFADQFNFTFCYDAKWCEHNEHCIRNGK